MQVRYDEDFVEAAVFLCVSGRRKGTPSLQVARFHRAREKLYTILDPDERNDAFFRLHLDWFREWGLEKLLADVVHEFPLLAQRLSILAVRKTVGRKDEGAELYVNETGNRTGLLALRLERLAQDSGFQDYLRHELMHLHDMVDPAFCYSPTLVLPGLNAAQRRVAHERYRLLWDITIDGRLSAGGHAPMKSRDRHAAAFAGAYSFWSAEKQGEVFDRLWRDPTPSHASLVSLIADPRGLHGAQEPVPGGSCPLCEFPTFNWADSHALSAELNARIKAEFPLWSPEQGLCRRCLETYEVLEASSPNHASYVSENVVV